MEMEFVIGISVAVIALVVVILVVYLVKTLIEVGKTMHKMQDVMSKVDENIAPVMQSGKGLLDETTKTIASVNRKLDKADEMLVPAITVKEELEKFGVTIGKLRKSVDNLTDNGKLIGVLFTYGQKAFDLILGVFQKKNENKVVVTQKEDHVQKTENESKEA